MLFDAGMYYLMKSEMGRARMRIFIGVTAQWERYKASIACKLAYTKRLDSGIALR